VPPKNRAMQGAEQLDPTALEQSGADPQQVVQQIHAEAKQERQNISSSAPVTSSISSSASTAPSNNMSTSVSSNNRRTTTADRVRHLDYTATEQSGADVQQSHKQIHAEVKQERQKTSPVNNSQSSPPRPPPKYTQLDPTYLEQSGVDVQQVVKQIHAEVKQERQRLSSSNYSTSPPGGSPGSDINKYPISPDYLLDQRNPVNVVQNALKALNQIVQENQDVLSVTDGRIDPSPDLKKELEELKSLQEKLEELVRQGKLKVERGEDGQIVYVPNLDSVLNELKAYEQKLKELLDKGLIRIEEKDGKKVIVSTELEVSIATLQGLFEDWKRKQLMTGLNKYAEELNKLGAELEDLLKSGKAYYVVVDENGNVVAKGSSYEEIKKIAEERGGNVYLTSDDKETLNKLANLLDKYKENLGKYKSAENAAREADAWLREELDKMVKEGRAVYVLVDKEGKVVPGYEFKDRETAEKAAKLYGLSVSVAARDPTGADATAVNYLLKMGQLNEKLVNMQNQILAETQPIFDRIRQLHESLTPKLDKYNQAAQTVATLSTIVNAFTPQLPVVTVQPVQFDPSKGGFVQSGSPTPVHIRDEDMRREVERWLRERGERVKAFMEVGGDKVILYDEKTNDGYSIDVITGEVAKLEDAKSYADDIMRTRWWSSLSDTEKELLTHRIAYEAWYKSLPPGLKELIGLGVTVKEYVPVVQGIEALVRAALGHEDPLIGFKKSSIEAQVVAKESPVTHTTGTVIGIVLPALLGGAGLLARGEKAGATGGPARVSRSRRPPAGPPRPGWPPPPLPARADGRG